MVPIPEEMKKFLAERNDPEYNGTAGVLAAMTTEGYPQAAPKHFRVSDSERLEFTDVFSRTLHDGLKVNPKVTIVFIDAKAVMGYRVTGIAELETTGPLFDNAASKLEQLGFKPKSLVKIRVESVQFLQYAPGTGKKIA